MKHNKEYFDPVNHEFITHPTYKGEGCAICGKPEHFVVSALWKETTHKIKNSPIVQR